MRFNTILVTLGSLVALATAHPASAWSQGWDWDEDFAPAAPETTLELTSPSGDLMLQDSELDALSNTLCVEGDTTCEIHA